MGSWNEGGREEPERPLEGSSDLGGGMWVTEARVGQEQHFRSRKKG